MRRFGSRRDFLFESGGGISGLGLACLLNQDNLLAEHVQYWLPMARCPPRSRTSRRARRASSRCS